MKKNGRNCMQKLITLGEVIILLPQKRLLKDFPTSTSPTTIGLIAVVFAPLKVVRLIIL